MSVSGYFHGSRMPTSFLKPDVFPGFFTQLGGMPTSFNRISNFWKTTSVSSQDQTTITTFHPLEFFSHCFNLYSIFEYTLYINDFDNLNSSPGCHWHELGEQTGYHKSFQGGNDEMTSEIVEPCIIYWQSQEWMRETMIFVTLMFIYWQSQEMIQRDWLW